MVCFGNSWLCVHAPPESDALQPSRTQTTMGFPDPLHQKQGGVDSDLQFAAGARKRSVLLLTGPEQPPCLCWALGSLRGFYVRSCSVESVTGRVQGHVFTLRVLREQVLRRAQLVSEDSFFLLEAAFMVQLSSSTWRLKRKPQSFTKFQTSAYIFHLPLSLCHQFFSVVKSSETLVHHSHQRLLMSQYCF